MAVQTVLVAMAVEAKTREEAEELVQAAIKNGIVGSQVDHYWIAEDDRRDESDNNSAVFVTSGHQADASQLLYLHGLTTSASVIYDSPVTQPQRRKNIFLPA